MTLPGASAFRFPRFVAVICVWTSACTAPMETFERVIEITAGEYTFTAPDTVAPGPAVLRLMNSGNVPHEVIVMKLRPGATVADLFAAQQRDEPFRPSLDGGNAVLFAQPGVLGDGRLTLDFEPGRDYVLWCNFQDSEGMPKHSAMGMFKRIHVDTAGGSGWANSPAVRVAVDAGDYIFSVPDTIPAGDTDFAMTNSGVRRHEIAFSRLKVGTTPSMFFAEYMKGNAVDSLYDDDGAILTAYGGDGNEFTVRINLMAGRSYVLLCEFSDTPEAPMHAAMGMFKGIAVR